MEYPCSRMTTTETSILFLIVIPCMFVALCFMYAVTVMNAEKNGRRKERSEILLDIAKRNDLALKDLEIEVIKAKLERELLTRGKKGCTSDNLEAIVKES